LLLIRANLRESVAKNLISVVQLGTVDYATGLRLQRQLVELRKAEKIGDILLLLEHSPVITLGRNAKAANVIASPELLAQRGVELFSNATAEAMSPSTDPNRSSATRSLTCAISPNPTVSAKHSASSNSSAVWKKF